MHGFKGVSTISDDTDIISIMSDACSAGDGSFCQGDFYSLTGNLICPMLADNLLIIKRPQLW